MPSNPYRLLMRYKRWATNELNAIFAANQERIDDGERMLVLRLLDHIQTVDDIFRQHLEGRIYCHPAPRSDDLPSFDTMQNSADEAADWYVGYADRLSPNDHDDIIDFTFADGSPGRMTRGEMLLHVAAHGTYHRGNIGIILQKNGIWPNADRMTDYLESEHPDRLSVPA